MIKTLNTFTSILNKSILNSSINIELNKLHINTNTKVWDIK